MNFLVSFIQGTCFELDEEMCADDDDREALQEIINNSKLSEGYLTLARDIEVMEPKSPEDIYKVWVFFSSSFGRMHDPWCFYLHFLRIRNNIFIDPKGRNGLKDQGKRKLIPA